MCVRESKETNLFSGQKQNNEVGCVSQRTPNVGMSTSQTAMCSSILHRAEHELLCPVLVGRINLTLCKLLEHFIIIIFLEYYFWLTLAWEEELFVIMTEMTNLHDPEDPVRVYLLIQ